MAPIKRKGNAPEETATRQPQKRAKVGAEDRKSESKPKDTAPKASELSVLRDDEPSFPRGGGSVLTPLERKQIQIQANKDVLFEQKGAKKPVREFADDNDDDDDDDEDVEMEDADTTGTAKKSRKKKSKGKKSTDKESSEKEGVRIEGLSYKRIVPGSMILGQVSSITAHDVAISLPNNLVGYVPLTSVSKVLDDKIEKLLNEQEDDDDEDDSSDDEIFDLKEHFYIGQYLRTYVVSTGTEATEAGGRTKKRIELSIDPRQANTGLSKSDLVVNSAVQAAVVSVEDHGVVMDLGIEGSDLKGFMSSKEVDPRVEYSNIKEGSVFLCMVTGQNASGNVIKLSSKLQSSASIKNSHFLSAAPTISSFLPGVAAEILLTEVTPNGMAGKIMGMLDTVVDVVQSGADDGKLDLERKWKMGAKIKGRIVSTFPNSEPFKIGFSMLDHVLKLSSDSRGPGSSDEAPDVSAIVPEVTVVRMDSSGMGLYVQIGETKHIGFVHISRLSDGKIESISAESGAYKIGSTHEARVVGYNMIDNLYLLSFEQSVIEQPFLRLEDVNVGAIVKGKVEKLLVGATGMDGLIVSLADGITGLVPSMHFADTQLQFPEKKFRVGQKISARILSVNLDKRQIRLTLKKSLLNSESAIWKDYKDIMAGAQSPGTIVNLQPHGAVVQFYGTVRGFLPVSEMSSAYIKDPAEHFRLGQVVNVHALSVDAAQGRLAVSCKDPSTFTEKYGQAFEDIQPGLLVSGSVYEKSGDDLMLKLEDTDLVARLDIQHIIDGSPSKQSSTLSKIRVGQKLNDLLVLDTQRAHRLIRVSSRASLKKAAKQGLMPSKFEDVQEGATVTGFVRNITPAGLFVEFLGGLTGLVPKRLIDDANLAQPQFGVSKGSNITVRVHEVDTDFQRFILSQKAAQTTSAASKKAKEPAPQTNDALANPVDEDVKTMSDLSFGRVVKCKVVSIKATQVNVQLADNIQGRIDVSEIFDKWEDLKDRKQPLRFFKAKQILSAKILGVHDARNHKFLPISHRSGKYPVFELSLKPSFIKATHPEPLNMDQVKVGTSWMGFVNNVADDCLWINLSPNVRGRLRFMDASDDLSLLTDVEKNFPIGSALKVQVTAVNAEKGHLDLSAKQGFDKLSFGDVSVGMILPGRVTKITEKQIIMQLGEALIGAVNLIDMADDYSKANPTVYHKNEVLRAYVLAVDSANKKISLSLRPSKVLSSSLPVQDREISAIQDLKPNDVVRGFIKRITDAGLFVAVGHDVTAYVRVSDLSDSYLKEWKDSFQADQLVKGRVTLVDAEQGKLQMSLKDSVLDPNFKAPITLRELKVGQIVTGKVRKVEEFGAFIVIDRSANVSGLCHRSEMAEKRVEDARTLYDEGDAVKAKIVKIDSKAGKISFSLKASHFQDEAEESEDEDMEVAGGVELGEEESAEEDDDDVSMGGVEVEDDSEEEEEDSDDDEATNGASKDDGLGASGFDWSGNVKDDEAEFASSDSDEDEDQKKKKKKKSKPEIQVDRTGDLDANGPQTVADYERLLLGEPDSSLLWLQYMAFQLELGEVEKARTIAERALRTITMGQDSEKLNIWVALLNLENTYGNDDSLEEVFKRACQYNDPQEMYERMISIYIQSGKNEQADELFKTAMKKKISNQSPKFFLNYASFLFDAMAAPERGRGLLSRALQSLPAHTHVETTSKFAQLEFRSTNGDIERGRTVFEGLLSSFPKRIDLWNVLIDLEMKAGDAEQVRRLFERVLGLQHKKGSVTVDPSKKVKPKQARFLFKKWLAFEEKLAAAEGGDEKMVEETKARAAAYVKSLQEEEQ